MKVAILAATARLPALTAQGVDIPANQRPALLQDPKQVAKFPIALLKLFPKLAGVHICTLISISGYRFTQKNTARNIFLKIFPARALAAEQEGPKCLSGQEIRAIGLTRTAGPSPLSELQVCRGTVERICLVSVEVDG